jgi:nucleoside-diphosphate-sugar epimerase
MTFLVTGATGAIGPCVVKALRVAGHRIRILARDVAALGSVPVGIDVRVGDITDPASVQSAMEGSEIVVHMAALLHVVNPTLDLQEEFRRVNVSGTETLVENAVKFDVKRVILFSTIAVYGVNIGQVLTENSPTHPGSLYAKSKLEAEQLVLNAKRRDGQPLGTVLRLATVYGSRIKGNYQRLLKALSKGRFIPVGLDQNRRALIYERDVAEAAVLASGHPSAGGKIYNVSDGQIHTLREIIGAICESLERNPPHFSLPIGPVRFITGVVEDVARMIGLESPIGRTTVDKYTEDVAVSSERIQRELGFVPQYDLAAGWQEAIQEMRRIGAL